MTDTTKQEPIIELENGPHRITLLGTAHISQASADAVKALLDDGGYDTVAIELCDSRYRSIMDPDALARLDLFQVIRQGKATMVAANLALGAFQQRLADELKVKPGAEMRTAIELAKLRELPLLLIDREISLTLKRVYHSVPWWQRINLVAGLLTSVLTQQKVSEEEIEKLKSGDMLESIFSQFAEEAEAIYRPLVDERDQYMVAKIQQETRNTSYRRMLVVVGAGHLAGIKDYLLRGGGWALVADSTLRAPAAVVGETNGFSRSDSLASKIMHHPDTVLSQLMELPKSGPWLKLIPWLIVVLILTGFAIGFSRNTDLGWELVMDWVIWSGGLAALGSLFALAHPVTILAAFISAPITTLNPAIGVGMVTGPIEALMRKPKVADFTTLRRDTAHWQGWWQNRVTRVLLVFIFSSIGSALGAYLAGYRIFEKLT